MASDVSLRVRSIPVADGSVHDSTNAIREFGRKASDYLLVISGCVAFIAARNLTSRGLVKIDQFEYWLIGLLPFLLIMLAGKAYRLYAPIDKNRNAFEEGFFASAWLLSLLLFVALRVTTQSETFEFPLYEALKYNYLIADVVLSGLYSVLGYAVIVAISLVIAGRRPSGPFHTLKILVGCILNAALFFALIFPPSTWA